MRLSTKSKIRAILDRGTRWFSGPLVFRALEDKSSGIKFSVLISKKVSPKAVVRNRVRRLFRESWRLLQPKVDPGWNILVLLQKEADVQSFKQKEIANWLTLGLKKKNLLQ